MSLSKKILVIGATGVIGKVLLDALLNAKDEFETIGIFTSPATVASKTDMIEAFKARGCVVRTGDLYSDEQVLEVYKDFDTVVSAVGRFAIDKQVDLIRLAEQSPNIIRFLPSEYGTDIAFDASSAAEKPHQKKLKVRRYLETSGAITRLKYTYLVSGPFADLYAGFFDAEPRAGHFDTVKHEAILVGDAGDAPGGGPVGMTTVADVGRALVGVLRHPEACDNKAVRVHSYVCTPREMLAEYERQTGKKWTVAYTSLDELRAIEADAWAAEHPVAAIFTLRRIWAEGKTLYAKTENEAIGLTKTDTIEMVVQASIQSPQSAFQSGKL